MGLSEREAYMLLGSIGEWGANMSPEGSWGQKTGASAYQKAQANIARIAQEEAEKAREKESEVFGMDLGPLGKPLKSALSIGSMFIPLPGAPVWGPAVISAGDDLASGRDIDVASLATEAGLNALGTYGIPEIAGKLGSGVDPVISNSKTLANATKAAQGATIAGAQGVGATPGDYPVAAGATPQGPPAGVNTQAMDAFNASRVPSKAGVSTKVSQFMGSKWGQPVAQGVKAGLSEAIGSLGSSKSSLPPPPDLRGLDTEHAALVMDNYNRRVGFEQAAASQEQQFKIEKQRLKLAQDEFDFERKRQLDELSKPIVKETSDFQTDEQGMSWETPGVSIIQYDAEQGQWTQGFQPYLGQDGQPIRKPVKGREPVLREQGENPIYDVSSGVAKVVIPGAGAKPQIINQGKYGVHEYVPGSGQPPVTIVPPAAEARGSTNVIKYGSSYFLETQPGEIEALHAAKIAAAESGDTAKVNQIDARLRVLKTDVPPDTTPTSEEEFAQREKEVRYINQEIDGLFGRMVTSTPGMMTFLSDSDDMEALSVATKNLIYSHVAPAIEAAIAQDIVPMLFYDPETGQVKMSYVVDGKRYSPVILEVKVEQKQDGESAINLEVPESADGILKGLENFQPREK